MQERECMSLVGWPRGVRDRVHRKPLAQRLAQRKHSTNVYFPVVTIRADEFIHRSLAGTFKMTHPSYLYRDEVLLLFFQLTKKNPI